MATEIEIKVRVSDHSAVRERLRVAGATCEGITHETNTFFDTSEKSLLRGDCGLRIRVNRRESGQSLVVTYKGPKRADPSGSGVKSREEIEVQVSDHDAAVALFGRLGYHVTLSFDKHRETWRIENAEVVLDTLPQLGTFVEVEAADDSVVKAVLGRLGLGGEPPVSESYIRMVAEWIEEHAPGATTLRFA